MSKLTLKAGAGPAPLLVSFPSGQPAGAADLRFSLEGHENPKKRRLQATSGKVRFQSKRVCAASAADLSRLVVGVFDPATGELSISEPQAVCSLDQLPLAPDAEAKSSALEGDMWSQRNLLVESFGSQKNRREVNSRAMNRVDANVSGASAVAKHISSNAASATAAAGGTDAESTALDAARRLRLPPFNQFATTPEEAFPPRAQLTQDDTMCMAEAVQAAGAAAKADEAAWRASLEGQHWPSWVVDRVGPAARADNVQLVEQLLFVRYLLAFHKTGKNVSKLASKVAEKLDAPVPVAGRLLKAFSEEAAPGASKRLRSTAHKDKLILHALAMMLACNDWQLELAPVAEEFKLTVKQLGVYLRELGCKVLREKATLKCPIEFPVKKRGAGSKRK